jgi:hypothetical protein
LSSELLVSIRVDERPPRRGTTGPDSVMLRITAYDLTARSQYRQRTLPAGAPWSVREEILAPLEALLLQTVGALEEMSRAPRRTPGEQETPLIPGLPNGAQIFINRGADPRVPIPPKKPPV